MNTDKIDEYRKQAIAALLNAATYKDFQELHFKLDQLEFLLTSKSGITPAEPQIIPFICCMADSCASTYKTYGAQLVNFNGKWYCKQHYPSRAAGAIFAVGVHSDSGNNLKSKGAEAIRAWTHVLQTLDQDNAP